MLTDVNRDNRVTRTRIEEWTLSSIAGTEVLFVSGPTMTIRIEVASEVVTCDSK
jgi:hypothetical protein